MKHKDPRLSFVFGRPMPDHCEEAPALVPPGMVLIYGLCDPFDGTIRYVGQTRLPESRLRQYADAATGNAFTWRWCRSLAKRNRKPDMVAIDLVAKDDWASAEAKWVEFYRERGHLYNAVPGGDVDHTVSIFREHMANSSKLKKYLAERAEAKSWKRKKKKKAMRVRDPVVQARHDKSNRLAAISARQMASLSR